MKETHSVFISYKSEEYNDANWIKTTLENNGIKCWMAPLSITGGASYASEIPKAIRECKIFVLLLSEKAQESKWVPRELDQAINEEKIIMPFVIKQCALKDDFNFYLSNVQRYDAYVNKSVAMEKMIKEIKAILKIEEEVQQIDAKENEPKKSKVPRTRKKQSLTKKKKIFGIAGAFILVLAFLGIFWISGGFTKKVTMGGKEVAQDTSYLSLQDTELTKKDLELIAGLENLTTLILRNCTLPDTDLNDCFGETLVVLELKNCGITDKQLASIDFEQLTKLASLNLQENAEISDLSVIRDVTDTLRILNISDTGIQDLEVVEECSELREFSAENLGLEDISVIKNCQDLQKLCLDGNKLQSLEILSEFTELQCVSVNDNQLSNLKGLEKNIRLTEIYAGYNNLTNLEGLENTTLLKYVFLNHNSITDISILEKSAATLEAVYLNDNKLENLASLANDTALKYLSADCNQIASVAALSDCSKLEQLSLAHNQIRSLEGIQNCVGITYLNLAGNEITDMGILAEISWGKTENLVWNLSDNQITTLALPQGVKFTFLDLHGNAITNLDVISWVSGSRVAFQYADGADYSKIKTAGFNYYFILDCPLDQQIAVEDVLGKYKVKFAEPGEVDTEIETYIPQKIKGVEAYYGVE